MPASGDAALAPQACVSATQTHDGCRRWADQGHGVGAQDAHHGVVGVAEARRAVGERFHRRLGIARQDLLDRGPHSLFAEPRGHANIGRKPARPRHGGVSNVAIDGNNTLEIKSLGAAICTFETLPTHHCRLSPHAGHPACPPGAELRQHAATVGTAAGAAGRAAAPGSEDTLRHSPHGAVCASLRAQPHAPHVEGHGQGHGTRSGPMSAPHRAGGGAPSTGSPRCGARRAPPAPRQTGSPASGVRPRCPCRD